MKNLSKKFNELSKEQLVDKQKSLLKELVSFKITMDPGEIKSSSNVVSLKRELRASSRALAVLGNK